MQCILHGKHLLKVNLVKRLHVHSSSDTKYLTGDIVFHKKNNTAELRRPGTVIGRDGEQVLVKLDSSYRYMKMNK